MNSSVIQSIGNQTSTTIKPPAASQQTSSLPVSILIDMLLFSHNQVFDCSMFFSPTELQPQKQTFECSVAQCDSPCTNFALTFSFDQPLIILTSFI